ncbi:MAG TPA: Ig-like domain repeat protein [Acidimicrobiales bacterium]|nr:Ig-like domain repeat protein [Acidimicrobiales bacterium]
MQRSRRIRAVVAVVAVGVTLLASPTESRAQPAPTLGGTSAGADAITARFDGTKAPSGPAEGATPNAVGDVTIQAQGCTPDPVAFGAQTTCTYAVQNQTQTATTVDLQATGDDELAVVGADQGAAVTGGTARAEDVALPPRTSSPIQINPGSTFAGYYALETIPINPQTISDDQILNYTVQPFRWNGATYTSLGVSANGYVVVGGADTSKDATAAPQDVPDAGRPNNVLAPFWTDLTPAGGGSLRVATVANTAQPPCERAYWFVAQWDMFEFGTTTNRKAQIWIQADDPECATDPVPPETIYFTYDFSTMTAAPARPFRIAAENSAGTVGGMRPAGQLPTSHYVVTSSGSPQPAPIVTWKVTGEGRKGGTGTIASTVESSLIPGSSTVFTDVTVSPQALPAITDQPDDATVTAGQQAVFSAAATGAASVRWQVSTDGGGSFDDVPGATSTTLAFTAHGADDGNQYRAVFANSSGGETTTDAAQLTVDQIATVTSVSASPAAPKVGQAVSFTATVAPSGATGTVQFAVDGTPLGSPVAVSGGSATSPSTSSLVAGDHAVTATYSGDADHAGSVGNGSVSVGKVVSTTGVTVDPAAPKVGDDVGFTATVAPSAATGTVQFTVDGTPLGGPVAVSGGTATSTELAGLTRGGHVVEAVYSGDATYASSTSGPVSFTVTRRATTTTVSVDPSSPERGEDVEFTAEVDPTPGGGTVQFRVDGAPFGSPVAVSGGSATSPSTDDLTAGDHTVSATYSGDDELAPSTSATATFTVAKRDSSTTVLDVRPDILSAGEDATVDLSVSPAPAGGTVQLALDGADVGGPIALDRDGEATATLPDLAVGERTLTATFSGDDDLLPSSDTEDLTVYEPREAFVRRAYPLVLGRPADAAGVLHHVRSLEGGAPPTLITRRLATSPEGRRRLVEQTFQRALGRSVDPDGRAFWVQRLESGLTAEDLLASVLASPEAYQRSGSDPEGIALALYRVHLARSADPGGLAHWTARVAAADTRAGRQHTATTFGRVPEATRVAVASAVAQACAPSTPLGSVLDANWVASGRNPLVLRGAALALACPPDGLTP